MLFDRVRVGFEMPGWLDVGKQLGLVKQSAVAQPIILFCGPSPLACVFPTCTSSSA